MCIDSATWHPTLCLAEAGFAAVDSLLYVCKTIFIKSIKCYVHACTYGLCIKPCSLTHDQPQHILWWPRDAVHGLLVKGIN